MRQVNHLFLGIMESAGISRLASPVPPALTRLGGFFIHRAQFTNSLKSAENYREAHLSAVEAGPQAPPWLPVAQCDGRRPQGPVVAPCQGSQAPQRLRSCEPEWPGMSLSKVSRSAA
jgi:hypothetical protein